MANEDTPGDDSSIALSLRNTFFDTFNSTPANTALTQDVDIIYEDDGPLLLDLNSRADSTGAYVKGFRQTQDGDIGAAEVDGRIHSEDELYAINDEIVTNWAFMDIIQQAKEASFPRKLTFRCKVSDKKQLEPLSFVTRASSWSVKMGQMASEARFKRTPSFDRGSEKEDESMATPTSSRGEPSNDVGTPPSKKSRDSISAFDKVRISGADTMKNLIKRMHGGNRDNVDRETLVTYMEDMDIRIDMDRNDNETVSSETDDDADDQQVQTGATFTVVINGKPLEDVLENDLSQLQCAWYRFKGQEDGEDVQQIQRLSSGRYVPSVDDVGSNLSVQVASTQFPQVSKYMSCPHTIALDPTVREMVDVLQEAGVGTFSATLASNELESFQLKITSECVQLIKITEGDDDGGIVSNSLYHPHLQVLLDPMDDRQFTFKVQAYGPILGAASDDICDVQNRDRLASVSAFQLHAPNRQHRDILSLLIRRFRGNVLSEEEEGMASRDELGLYLDPAYDPTSSASIVNGVDSSPSEWKDGSGQWSDLMETESGETTERDRAWTLGPEVTVQQSQTKEMSVLREKLASLSVQLASAEMEHKQLQQTIDTMDERAQTQEMRVQELERTCKQLRHEKSELEKVKETMEVEMEDMKEKLTPLEPVETTEDSAQTEWAEEEVSREELMVTIDRLERLVERKDADKASIEQRLIDVTSERNALKHRSEELAKELKVVVGQHRSVDDVEAQLAERNHLAAQLAMARADLKQTQDEMEEYKDAYEVMRREEGLGEKQKSRKRLFSQNVELQRVVQQLTESLNDTKIQLSTSRDLNRALAEKVQAGHCGDQTLPSDDEDEEE